jgi:hypothetical protein
MGSFLVSAWVQVGGIPVMLLIVGVVARRLGRRDGDPSPRANDWAVGTTLLLMVLGTIVGDLRTQTKILELLGWLIGVLFTIFLSIDHDRYRSWVRDANGIPTTDKRLFWGVIAPDVLCLVVFAAYQAWKVNLI